MSTDSPSGEGGVSGERMATSRGNTSREKEQADLVTGAAFIYLFTGA